MKKCILFCLSLFFSLFLFAQLDKVAPLTAVVHDPGKTGDINILLSTKEFSSIFFPALKDKYPTTVQLCHLNHPFPPIWYMIGTHRIGPGLSGSDFFLGPIINDQTGRLSFSASVVPDMIEHPGLKGYVILDTARMEPADTLIHFESGFDSIYEPVDNHEYEEDAHGNKLFFSSIKIQVDGRCLSGNAEDSLMTIVTQCIVVLDTFNKVKLFWNPLHHFSPCEMYWEYRNASTSFDGAINWSHGNSLRWANDGNILYSYRHIGIGKINSKTGAFMFKLGGKDSLHAIPVPDSIGYSLQHDFYQRPDGKYSLFSNGASDHLPFMRGLIYDIDEINGKVSLADAFEPQPPCISKALGGLDTYRDMYFLCHGMQFCPGKNKILEVVNIKDKRQVAELYMPFMNFPYRAHPTTWDIARRPKIQLKATVLKTDSLSGLYGYTWYKVNDTLAEKAGEGLVYTPIISGKYVVEARAGRGSLTSFLLSDVLEVSIRCFPDSEAKQITCCFSPAENTLRIILKEDAGFLALLTNTGKLLRKIVLKKGVNLIKLQSWKNVSSIDIHTKNDHLSGKIRRN